MKKKNINWNLPEPLADRFSEVAEERWGLKGKWVAAGAAAMMYLDADDEKREQYGNLALTMRGTRLSPEIQAKLVPQQKSSEIKGIRRKSE